MAIATLDQLVTAQSASSSQRRSWICDNALGNSTTNWYDHWFATHTWGLSSTPATGAGELLTNASPGAIPLTAPGGGNTLYLAGLAVSCTVIGEIFIYDRLWQVGGLDQSSTATQTITGATITRPDTNGNDVEVWAIAQAAGNFYAPTFTLHYKNAAGTDHNADTIMPTNAFHNQYAAFPLNLAAGDNQVASVVSIKQNSGGNAVNFALVALRRIATLNIKQANFSYQLDGFQLGYPTIDSGACLSFMFANATSGAVIDSHLTIVEG